MNEFIYPFEISSFDAGYNQFIMLSTILKYQQEAGGQHLQALNCDYNSLYNKGLIFVVTNTTAIIHRLPNMLEKLKIVTYSRGIKGVKFYRCYNWLDENSKVIIESCSCFALVDTKNHCLLRPDVLGDFIPSCFERVNAAGNPKKIKLPDNLSQVGSRKIYYSDIDYNGHLNNSYYADFITDFMPDFNLIGKMKAFNIDFVKEAVIGDELQIKVGVADNTIYYAGTHQKGECFRASCVI